MTFCRQHGDTPGNSPTADGESTVAIAEAEAFAGSIARYANRGAMPRSRKQW